MNAIVALLVLFLSAVGYGQTADEILQRADLIRNPVTDFMMEVSVETEGMPEFRFRVGIGARDASVIRTLSPRREVGKNYLMLNRDMWAYLPRIRRSIRVTLNQKLTGQASNGDICRTRWYGDYAPMIETTTGNEWVLLLTARKEGLTYEKIRVWIDRSTFRPKKGEFLTSAGKVLKTISFEEYAEMAGEIRPVRMVIQDANKRDQKSTLRILSMKSAQFSTGHFSRDNLK